MIGVSTLAGRASGSARQPVLAVVAVPALAALVEESCLRDRKVQRAARPGAGHEVDAGGGPYACRSR